MFAIDLPVKTTYLRFMNRATDSYLQTGETWTKKKVSGDNNYVDGDVIMMIVAGRG